MVRRLTIGLIRCLKKSVSNMSEVLVIAKVALKLILGSTALGAGATLVKKGIQDAAKVKLPK